MFEKRQLSSALFAQGWNTQLKVQDINSTALVVHAPFCISGETLGDFQKGEKNPKNICRN